MSMLSDHIARIVPLLRELGETARRSPPPWRYMDLIRQLNAGPAVEPGDPRPRVPALVQEAGTAEERWHAILRCVGCVICRRFVPLPGMIEIHHVASGTGLRSEFSVAPLCRAHHRAPSIGLHGLSPSRFASLYQLPGEVEWGLLVWVNEDVSRLFLPRLLR